MIYKDIFINKMEVRRRLRKKKLTNDIRDTGILIERSNVTIKRLKNSQMGEVYVLDKIKKLKWSIVKKEALLEQLEKEFFDVSSGDLDIEIDKEYKNNDIRVKKFVLKKLKF